LLCLGGDYQYLLVLGLLALLALGPFLQIPFLHTHFRALLAIAELTEILVVRMDKPIVAAMNIGSLLFIENNSLLWYIRSAKQQLVRI
jgi:hypothetical protein